MALKNALIMQNDNGTTTTAIQIDTAITSNNVPVVINAAGNVGIGTSSPSEKLDVIGSVQGKQLIATNGIVVNSATIDEDYTIATGNNAHSVGPLTVNAVVTVSAGSIWVIQ